MRKCILAAACALVLGALHAPAYAVINGQIDTFEDGTTDGWVTNLLGQGSPPNPPTNVSTGGPGGIDDNYMLVTSTGEQGPGGKLVVINPAQWSGNYLGAGVSSITMSLNNFGDTDLSLHLLFESVGDFGPTDVAATTDGFTLAAHSGWVTATFDITPSALTSLLGTVDNALTDATVLRLYHNPTDAGFPPPNAVASLGVDNVQAVPEPGTMLATAAGLGLLARRRRKAK